VTVTEAPASVANTEATEDEQTEDFLKKNLFFSSVRQPMEEDGGADGQQAGEAGTDISSTPSGDVDMFEGQDQELVAGTWTHLGGVVAKARAEVNTNASEKVTEYVLSRRILEYGLVKAERDTNLV
jgi:hypothetical protein